MKHTNTRRGFTLMELLVVVLIVGVLAAVVVPQYQKAVLKSKFSTLFPLAKALQESNEAYYLSNGAYAEDADELDVSAPEADVQITVKNEERHQYVQLTRSELHNRLTMYQNHSPNFAGETHCEALLDDERASQLCKDSLQGTFVGNKFGYAVYSLDPQTVGSLARVVYDQRYGTLDPGDDCIADGSKYGGTACLSLHMAGGICKAYTSNSCSGSTFTEGATCIGHTYANCRASFTDSSCISNGGDGTCGYSPFVNSTCEAANGCCSGCAYSSFTNSACTGNAAGGCRNGTFTDNSTCVGNLSTACTSNKYYANSVCYANAVGACAGATYDDTSYCSGSYCPSGAASNTAGKVWYRGSGKEWPETRASELVDAPQETPSGD